MELKKKSGTFTIDDEIVDFAREILKENGCDIFTYGDTVVDVILYDLKEKYHDELRYPYVDVANAIKAISVPHFIYRPQYAYNWSNEHSADCDFADTEEYAKDQALYTLSEWVMEEIDSWEGSFPTEEQISNFDYMIDNCYVEVRKYNPYTDKYESYWIPSPEEEEAVGWMYWEEYVKKYGVNVNDTVNS